MVLIGFIIMMLGLALVTFGATNTDWFANPALVLGFSLAVIGLVSMIVATLG